MNHRHTTHFLLAALVAAATVMVGCDMSTPTSAQTQSGSDSSSAKVRATGALTFTDCGSGGCTAQGKIVNDGPSCVSNVHGVTHLFDADGKEIESKSWTINGRVIPESEKTYNACCFSTAARDRYKTFTADIEFNQLDCI